MKVGDVVWLRHTRKGPFVVVETNPSISALVSNVRSDSHKGVMIRHLDGSKPNGVWPDGRPLEGWNYVEYLTKYRPLRPGTGRLQLRRFWRKYHKSMVMLSASLAALASASAALVMML